MKKNIFIITLILLILGNSISFSQDLKIDETLESLSKKLELNRKELNNITGDLIAIGQSQKGKGRLDTINYIISDVEVVQTIYLYQLYLIDVKNYVSNKNLNAFLLLINKSLYLTKENLEYHYKLINNSYPYLKTTPALHSVDKARKNISDMAIEIKSAIRFLNSIITSKT